MTDPTPLQLHTELERRVTSLEVRIGKIDERISGLHSDSMSWVTAEFVSVRNQVTQELTAVRKDISDTRISMYRMQLTLFVQFAVILAEALITHFWR